MSPFQTHNSQGPAAGARREIAAALTGLTPEMIDRELAQGRPVDLKNIPRQERLAVINNYLTHKRLKTFPVLGDGSKGRPEITGINGKIENEFVTRIHFQVEVCSNDGKKTVADKMVNFNANTVRQTGSIIVPIVSVAGTGQSYILLVKQFRDAVGTYTLEVPRGFSKGDLADVTGLPLIEELAEETGISTAGLRKAGKLSCRAVGMVFENTGVSNIENTVFRVDISLTPEEFAGIQGNCCQDKDGGQTNGRFLIPLEQARMFVKDAHTMSALFMVMAG